MRIMWVTGLLLAWTAGCPGMPEMDAGEPVELDAGTAGDGDGDVDGGGASELDAGAADGGRPQDSGPDPLPLPPTIAHIDVLDRSPPLGGTTMVAWWSDNAESCTLHHEGDTIGEGTAGQAELTVDGLETVTLYCQGAVGVGASTASMRVAPACTFTTQVDELFLDGVGATDGAFEPIVVEATECLEVAGTVSVFSAGNPDLASRVSSAANVFFMNAGDEGGSFARLTSAGISLDYCNGVLSSAIYSYPVMTDMPGSIRLVAGRADLRSVVEPAIAVMNHPLAEEGRLVVIDPPERLGWLQVSGNVLPLFTEPITSVAGDVIVRNNDQLDEDTINAFIAQLGTIEGALTVCGNKDDEACP